MVFGFRGKGRELLCVVKCDDEGLIWRSKWVTVGALGALNPWVSQRID